MLCYAYLRLDQPYYLCFIMSLQGKTLEDKSEAANPFDAQDILGKVKNITEISQAERVNRVLVNKQKALRHFTLNQYVNKLKTEYNGVLSI